MDKEERNIKYIKLNNGEDLVSEIETSNELEYTFKNPMKIVVDTDLESSKQIIFLHPWLPSGVVQATTVQLHASVIFLTTEVLEDVKEYYVNIVGEIEMSETIKKKQKRKKTKIVAPEPSNVLDFNDIMQKLKKDKPIH